MGMREEEGVKGGYWVEVWGLGGGGIGGGGRLEEIEGMMKGIVKGDRGGIIGWRVFCMDGGEVINLVWVGMKNDLD